MKKVFLTLIMILSLQALFAQSKFSSERVKKQIEVLKNSDLKLSEIQLSRITSVLNAEDEIKRKNELTYKDNSSLLKIKITEINEHIINNIKGAMSPLQVDKFNQLKLVDKLL